MIVKRTYIVTYDYKLTKLFLMKDGSYVMERIIEYGNRTTHALLYVSKQTAKELIDAANN